MKTGRAAYRDKSRREVYNSHDREDKQNLVDVCPLEGFSDRGGVEQLETVSRPLWPGWNESRISVHARELTPPRKLSISRVFRSIRVNKASCLSFLNLMIVSQFSPTPLSSVCPGEPPQELRAYTSFRKCFKSSRLFSTSSLNSLKSCKRLK